MFVSVSAFAVDSQLLATRNVYSILSENFSGAMQETGYEVDNIRYYTWAQGGYTAPTCKYEEFSGAIEGKKYLDCTIPKGGAGGTGSYGGFCYQFVPSSNGNDQAFREEDLTRYKYLDFWIKPISGDIANLKFGITDYLGDKTKTLSEWGYSNVPTGEWFHCTLDLTTLSNVRLNRVKNPFLVLGNNLSSQTKFYIDNIVLRTDESSAAFNISLKNIEDYGISLPENPTQIKWIENSVFHNAWKASYSYVELDMDMYSYKWTVRMYTNNGGTERGGLYARLGSKDYVIPMCWRAYNGTLVNEVGTGNDTYLIAQSTASHHNLYDGGVNSTDEGYYTWFYMKDIADVDLNKPGDVDYITVWDSSLGGYHGEVNAVGKGYYSFDTVEKKPKVYFGGGFDSAAGGITYTANVVIELNYE